MKRYSGKAKSAVDGGRRQRRREETSERIFTAAVGLFSRQGFAQTTVEEITRAADVGKGTFFNYFPSKEHVLAFLVSRQFGTMRATGSMRARVTSMPGRFCCHWRAS